MRDYLSVNETGKIIASEVVADGNSKGWGKPDQNGITLAIELEKHLAKFNIGLKEPRAGIWGTVRNGTRYFNGMRLLKMVKTKVSSLTQALRKE